eukprot:6280066-Prymnesium_polylepis.1
MCIRDSPAAASIATLCGTLGSGGMPNGSFAIAGGEVFAEELRAVDYPKPSPPPTERRGTA